MTKHFIGIAIFTALSSIAFADNKVIEFSGTIEIEAANTDEKKTLDLSTFEIGIAAKISEGVSAEGVIAKDDAGKMELDTATITFGDTASKYFTAGLMTLPFGNYETTMISDPMTLMMGETGGTALQVGMAKGALSGSLFSFKTDNKVRYGLNISMAEENKYAVGISYINKLSEADGFDKVDTGDETIAGLSSHASIKVGLFGVSAEYLTASKKYKLGNLVGQKPSAYNLEVAYDFTLGGKSLTAALGHQESKQAEGLGLAETSNLASLAVELKENTSLSFEYRKDKDYTGVSDDILTAFLGVKF